jgi:hypothetical protein
MESQKYAVDPQHKNNTALELENTGADIFT